MIVTAFDARQARQLKPGGYLAFREHPGLRFVVGQTRRTWLYRYAQPETGKQKQVRLGDWPAIGFGQAVDLWEASRAQRDRGVDVGEVKRAAKRAEREAAEERARRTERTCAWVVEQYLSNVVEPNRKAKGAAETRRMLERAAAGVAAWPASDLTRGQAHEIILSIAKTAPRVAAMTRQALRACWNHAADAEYVTGPNPFAGATTGGKFRSKPRERVLSTAEVGALTRWFAEPKAYSRTVADALDLTLRTGLRSGEVCGIRTSELRERNGVLWLDVPAERMKGGKQHAVPLVGRTRALVEARAPADGGFIFASRAGDRPIEQKVLGVEVYACSGRSKAKAYAYRRVCPVKDWAPHDLRRTARTLLAELGCPFEVGEAILAHELPGVAKVYSRAKFETQKVEWLTKLNEHLDALATSSRGVAKKT